MKKIGILTLPLSNNYGGILQAAALYYHLEKKGHQVILIQKKTHRSTFKKIAIKILKNIPFQNINNFRSTSKQTALHKAFIDKHIPNKTRPGATRNDLEEIASELNLDAVIVGSDQVWRMDYINDGYYSSYFLDFIKNQKTKKIAYAASFGKDYWQASENIQKTAELLSKFDAVSTREKSGITICQETLQRKDCVHTLDPTLLVDDAFYSQLTPSSHANRNKKTIATYILDESPLTEEAVSSAHKTLGNNHEVIHLSGRKASKIHTIPEWIQEIKDADFVITDSFHGMVFSILLNKQFIIIINNSRGGARFESLLDSLEIKDRILQEESTKNISQKIQNPIDYNPINKKLSILRKESDAFIENSLM
ncbi:Polysaccharide pyruvyl transferase [compost metagenome]